MRAFSEAFRIGAKGAALLERGRRYGYRLIGVAWVTVERGQPCCHQWWPVDSRPAAGNRLRQRHRCAPFDPEAWAIDHCDAVFLQAFTFAASSEVVALAGVSPVVVDVLPDTFSVDFARLDAVLALVKRDDKQTPKAVMAVELFGQPADYLPLEPVVRRESLKLLRDTAQSLAACWVASAQRNRRRCSHQLLPCQAAGLV